ncbi:LPS export ABC transporter permease LptF [Roseomonas sp. NAR14]|uniref:LPS export ABC transporter permease LptF n=1 Tax=Roseomonas acroporae TaxID=2937791 RepID=A0A9X1Y3Y4_9PROT|nr:LPS export ABC transporter permease LptF [Roseomonas acroporae]MCK8782843.1 LPS export ABC transporter permease LptF [Roseomonas acroporae]
MPRIDRYILRQLLVSLFAVTVGLAALVWLTQSLRFIELVLDRGLSLAVFVELTSLMLPSFFAVILPITTFVVALFCYIRLAADRELVVMRAAGLSQWRLSRPVLALALLSTLLCYGLNLWLVPISHTAFRTWQYEIRNQMAAILLQEGVFSSVGGDLTVYARRRDRDGTLHGILVHDARDRGNPVTILAEAGRIASTPQGPRVTLINGVRQQVERVAPPAGSPPGTPATSRLSSLSFAENTVDLARATRSEETRNRDSRERSLDELFNPDPAERLPQRDIDKYRAEGHQRLSAPLTAISFAMVALAVSLTGGFRRHGGALRIAAGVLIVVGLLALGLAVGNLAAKRPTLIPLIWLHAIAPGLVAAWWVAGAPGVPRRAPRRPQPSAGFAGTAPGAESAVQGGRSGVTAMGRA